MARQIPPTKALLPSALLLLLLSAQLCSAAFLDGDELSPGANVSTHLLAPGLGSALGLRTGQHPEIGMPRFGWPDAPRAHVEALDATLTSSAPTVLIGSDVTLTAAFSAVNTTLFVGMLEIKAYEDTSELATVAGTIANMSAGEVTVISGTYNRLTPALVRFEAQNRFIFDNTSTTADTTSVNFIAPTTTLLQPLGEIRVGQATQLSATVTGVNSSPVSGATVTFVITQSGGQPVQVPATTDANGGAATPYAWPATGTYTVTAQTRPLGVPAGQETAATNSLTVNVLPPNPSITADATTALVNTPVKLTAAHDGNVPANLALVIFTNGLGIALKPGSADNTGLTVTTDFSVATPALLTFASELALLDNIQPLQTLDVTDRVTVTWVLPPTTRLSPPAGDLRVGQTTRLTATVTLPADRTRAVPSRQLTGVSVVFVITGPNGINVRLIGIPGPNGSFYVVYTWPGPGAYTVTTETSQEGVKGTTSSSSLTLNVLAAIPVLPVDFTRIFLFARTAGGYYSDSTHLTAAVLDTAGQPLPGVRVTFTLVHACASRLNEYSPCVDNQQAVTDSEGEAVISYRGPTDEDAYAIARARNNQGTLISSRRVSLWPEHYQGYAAAQATP